MKHLCPLVLAALALSVVLLAPADAAPTVVKEWKFTTAGDLQGWVPNPQCAGVKVADGVLQGTFKGADAFLSSPQFEAPATPWQDLVIRMKTDVAGGGEVFYTNTTNTPYQGFTPGKSARMEFVGDGQWHEYRLRPYWQAEGKIILLRLDFPISAEQERSFAIEWIRIEDNGAGAASKETAWDFSRGANGWTTAGPGSAQPTAQGLRFEARGAGFQLVSPALSLPLDDYLNCYVRLTVSAGGRAQINWAARQQSGLKSTGFVVRADGQPHSYNVDMSAAGAWAGEGLLLSLTLPPGSSGVLQQLAVTQRPQGPADIEIVRLIPENALSRAGQPVPLLLTLENHGAEPARGLKLAEIKLPAGVQLVSAGRPEAVPDVPGGDVLNHRFTVRSAAPARGEVQVRLAGPGAPVGAVSCTLDLSAAPRVSRGSYIPEPQPLQSDYEIGAFYFPGWESAAKWDPIQRIAPERKPVLGWYDESNPECVDWQIKWAVEHGIKVFYVDWYWSAGGRHLEHWVKAFEQARFRKYLKWCVMWANHNAPKTHSEADQRAVTQYWIDHCFSMPEYYRINDMPVVQIWSPWNMRNDMGGSEGVKKLLDISREMAKAAGYKGIYFMAMNVTSPADVDLVKAEGFDMTSIYHYMGHGGKAPDPLRFSFDLVADSSPEYMAGLAQTSLPYLPNISTGWDSRPWHGDAQVVIHGRTVPLFRRICEDTRRFADAQGIKRLALGPLNEWGEGSYAEPCLEFGFGMYDVVQEVFGRKPAGGWPVDFGPADIGRGPYDYPAMTLRPRQAWDFTDGAQGWSGMMGLSSLKWADGMLQAVTGSRDPAIQIAPVSLNAWDLRKLTVRMKLTGQLPAGDAAQLFWSLGKGHSEALSQRFAVTADGQWHDYVVDLGANKRWQGKMRGLRFDPCNAADVQLAIAAIRFE